MSSLRINISNLSEGVHQRSLEAEPTDVGLDKRFTRTVRLEAALEKTSRQLFLRVEFTTGGTFTCDRCLDQFEKEVSDEYSLVYVTDGRSVEGLDDEEVQVITSETNHIDLGEDVRQFAILGLPQKLLCKEECPGLCPQCGTNWNKSTCTCREEGIDPRWEELKKFIQN